MKVLFVIDSLGAGGSERSLAEMLPYLAAAGVEPLIACFYRRRGVEGLIAADGFEIRRLDGSLWERVRALRALWQYFRPHLLHSTLFEANLIGRIAAMGAGPPVLTSLVNLSYAPIRFRDPNLKPYRLRMVQAIDRWTGHFLSHHFHAVSEAVRDSAIRDLRIPPERISVVRRGRDPQRLGRPSPDRRLVVRKRLGLFPDDSVIVNVGRQEYGKGQRHLIEAAARLVKSHPHLTVLIAGKQGQASADLEELASSPALGGRVRLLGHREDVPDILAAADVFALPSLFEGFPGAALEAMALGLPVVGSDIGPLQEVLGAEGAEHLTPPQDAAALATALDRMLTHPSVATALGRRNRERFLSELTIEHSAESMIGLYHRILDPSLEPPSELGPNSEPS